MTRNGHYLSRDPGGFLPWLALCGNILLLVFLIVQVRGAHGPLSVGFAAAHAGAPAAGKTAQLKQAGTGQWELDGRLIADSAELEKRLTLRAPDAAAIMVIPGASCTAKDLGSVLRACSQAGFTNVFLDDGRAEGASKP